MKTIVLLSGGLDSATVLAMAEHCNYHYSTGTLGEAATIAFDYGQPHKIELQKARALAERYKVPFEVITVPAMPRTDDVVFVGRNLVFASIAIAVAQARGFDRIGFGCNASDWKRFPDCRPEFWGSLRRCAEAYGVDVWTPLLHKTKREVAGIARELLVPIELTWSCYSPKGEEPCGACLACTTRKEALCS